MATTLPADATKANLDSGADDPKLARVELADLVDKVNALTAALGAAAQLNPGDGLEALAQAPGTPDDLAAKLQANPGLVRAATGLAIDPSALTAETALADDDVIAFYDTSAAARRKATLANLEVAQRGFIDGFQMVRSSGDSQDLNIGTGLCRNDADDGVTRLGTAFVKGLDIAWAAGSGAGMLQAGSSIAADKWYDIYAIKNPTTGASDILARPDGVSLSLPSGFTRKRRIGSVLTDGSSLITEFLQDGDDFWWKSPPLDINLTNTLTTTARNDVISVPPGRRVLARLHLIIGDGSSKDIYIASGDFADLAPSTTAAPLMTVRNASGSAANGWQIEIRTDASSQIRARAGSGIMDSYRVATLGWIDTRGKDA